MHFCYGAVLVSLVWNSLPPVFCDNSSSPNLFSWKFKSMYLWRATVTNTVWHHAGILATDFLSKNRISEVVVHCRHDSACAINPSINCWNLALLYAAMLINLLTW